MSVSAFETRETKLKWLLQPLQWASTICFWGALMAGFMWFDGNVSTETIAIVASASLFVTFGLIFWSSIRIARAARGQY